MANKHSTKEVTSNQTQFTRTGVVDMANKKPYRTKANKQRAKDTAKMNKDGHFTSNVPVSYHKGAPAQ